MKEYADRQLRSGGVTATDRRRYSGIARIAQAREWMSAKLENAMVRSRTGRTESERNGAACYARRLHSEMTRMGMGPQKRSGADDD